MKLRLLDFLICPFCHGNLRLHDATSIAGEIDSGILRCDTCGRQYPVRDGVPRFVSEAQPLEQIQTARAFGYEWKQFSELTPDYEKQFLDWIAPIGADFFEGRIVLDAGCGKGRHLACAAKFGAREVVGVDLSEAVDASYHNTRHLTNVHVIQADIYHLPLRRETFDYVYSIGVLHHLPDPRRGFQALIPIVSASGRISAWVYGRENNGWIVYLVSPLRSVITARLPLSLLNFASAILTALLLWPALRLIYRPVNMHCKTLARHLFYNDYLAYISKFSFKEVRSIVFDHLVAPTAHYLTREEFEEWFAGQELADVCIQWHNQNSWRGTAVRKPLVATERELQSCAASPAL